MRQFISILLLMSITSCLINSKYKVKSEKLIRLEFAAIETGVSSPIAITEERIFKSLSKRGVRKTINDSNYLSRFELELKRLKPSGLTRKPVASFLFSGLLYYEGKEDGIYLSFTGFHGKYYMFYNKELYEWNQDLANLIYEKLPKRIMDSVYEEIK